MGLLEVVERNNWPRLERIQRREQKRFLRSKGVRPAKKQWVICVETTAIEIPAWAQAKADKRFTLDSHRAWFRGRNSGRAKILERQDREAGGKPELTAVEWRLCPVCKRVLLSLEASARRRLDESGVNGRQIGCSGECGNGHR